ncbi:benzoate/H(+) symporter BenE family transporter [Streptomyces sp. NPDC051162]|uniref:benzoate/H(+) symporter BenE family transporter n=1 Tax=unclassified Streptomyces TaxID=2593676 RepID=UPI0034408460
MTARGRGPRAILADTSLSAITAGAIAVLVSFAGPLAVVVQAAHAAGLDEARLSSWIWAISLGSGLTGLVLSLRFRAPVVAAWSTPGAALLVTQLGHYPYREAIGAYLGAAALTVVVGLTGWLEALMRRVPAAVVSAMLAGVLLRFGLDAFGALGHSPAIAGAVLGGYVLCRRIAPRYAVLTALALGVGTAAATHGISLGHTQVALARPVFTAPHWSAGALVGLALPLFLVTMTSQNAPGAAVLRAAGYEHVPTGPLIRGTGAASVVFAPFGAHALNLAAITAAICTGPEAHEDRDRRYVAGLSCGVLYVAVGLFGATVAGMFAALPPALVAATSGVALLGVLGTSLGSAFTGPADRDSALVAFLATASGVTLFGIGSAFWGLVFGVVCRVALSPAARPGTARTDATEAEGPGRG